MNRTGTDLTPTQLREYAEMIWSSRGVQNANHINRFEQGYNCSGVAIKAGRSCGDGLTPAQRAWRKRHPGIYGSDADRAALLATARQTVDPDNGFTVYRFEGVDDAKPPARKPRAARSVKEIARDLTPLDRALYAFRALDDADRAAFLRAVSPAEQTKAGDEALAALEREIDAAAVGEQAPARVANTDWAARLKKLQGL